MKLESSRLALSPSAILLRLVLLLLLGLGLIEWIDYSWSQPTEPVLFIQATPAAN